MKWYLIKLDINGAPYERSQSFDEEPALEDGWDAVWSQTQWDDYLASQVPPVTTLADLMSAQSVKPYSDFRAKVLAFCLEMGGGDEQMGFDAATAEEKQFFALNLIGTLAQRQTVLYDENKQVLEWRLSKNI